MVQPILYITLKSELLQEGAHLTGGFGQRPCPHGHGNDSILYRAVEPDSLIAVLRHFFCFANSFFISLIT